MIYLGDSTVIDPQSSVISGYLPGYAIGGLCFDQQSQTYIVWVSNETGSFLKLVDVYTSNIIASTAISSDNYFYELQADNFTFAIEAYNLSAKSNKEDNLHYLKIYPNPTSDYIFINSDLELEAIVYDILGKEIKREYFKDKLTSLIWEELHTFSI